MISAGAIYSRTISQTQCPYGETVEEAYDTEFIFTNTPISICDGTLTISVKGDYDSSNEGYI